MSKKPIVSLAPAEKTKKIDVDTFAATLEPDIPEKPVAKKKKYLSACITYDAQTETALKQISQALIQKNVLIIKNSRMFSAAVKYVASDENAMKKIAEIYKNL